MGPLGNPDLEVSLVTMVPRAPWGRRAWRDSSDRKVTKEKVVSPGSLESRGLKELRGSGVPPGAHQDLGSSGPLVPKERRGSLVLMGLWERRGRLASQEPREMMALRDLGDLSAPLELRELKEKW